MLRADRHLDGLGGINRPAVPRGRDIAGAATAEPVGSSEWTPASGRLVFGSSSHAAKQVARIPGQCQ
jgi:hypothetical protein